MQEIIKAPDPKGQRLDFLETRNINVSRTVEHDEQL